MTVCVITKNNVIDFADGFGEYRKKVTTRARRLVGPFTVETPEGTLTCQDGYLAIDSRGFPYPIDREEFEAIYEPVQSD